MRIVGYIDHPQCKITIFKMDSRFAVKFESGLYEQTYKFRVGNAIETVEDVRHFVDPEFVSTVLERFADMHRSSREAMGRLTEDMEKPEEFEIII